MSQMRANAILDASGGNTAQINGALAINTTNLRTELGASGAAPIFSCRAWVNFNGTTGAIRASGNVSSVVKNGVGDYTVNFTTSMPDENYSFLGTAGVRQSNYGQVTTITVITASSVRFVTTAHATGVLAIDPDQVHVAIFR